MVRQESEKGVITGFVDTSLLDILTALSRVGEGDPVSAGKQLAVSADEAFAGGHHLYEGDYLALFAAFRAELDDREVADELLEIAPVRNGHINWLVGRMYGNGTSPSSGNVTRSVGSGS